MADIDFGKGSALKQALEMAAGGGHLMSKINLDPDDPAVVPEEEKVSELERYMPEDILTPEGLAELIKRISEKLSK